MKYRERVNRRSRSLAQLVALGIALGLAGKSHAQALTVGSASPGPIQPGAPVTSDVRVPLQGLVSTPRCEAVTLNGALHVLVVAHPPNPTNPPEAWRAEVDISGPERAWRVNGRK